MNPIESRAEASTGAAVYSRIAAKPLRPSISPEVFKAIRRQLGIAHRVLDVAMAEVGLKSSRIMALVGQGEAAGVAQHVRMD